MVAKFPPYSGDMVDEFSRRVWEYGSGSPDTKRRENLMALSRFELKLIARTDLIKTPLGRLAEAALSVSSSAWAIPVAILEGVATRSRAGAIANARYGMGGLPDKDILYLAEAIVKKTPNRGNILPIEIAAQCPTYVGFNN